MADGHIAEGRAQALVVPREDAGSEVLDRVGVGISLGCAVHCVASAALSVVPSLLSGSVSSWLELLEWPFILGAMVIGVTSLAPAYRRHGDVRPLALFGVGMSLLGLSRVVDGPLELALTVTAVLGIATAHVVNMRLCACRH